MRDMLTPYIQKGVCDPDLSHDWPHVLALAWDKPETCRHFLDGRVAMLPKPGQTTAPARPPVGERHTLIVNANREYGSDAINRKLTSVVAFVNMRLSEAGLAPLTDDEAADQGDAASVAR